MINDTKHERIAHQPEDHLAAVYRFHDDDTYTSYNNRIEDEYGPPPSGYRSWGDYWKSY